MSAAHARAAPRELPPLEPPRPAVALAPDAALDRALVDACRGGDRAAFATLYRRHAPTTYRRLVRLVGGRADAEDLLQQVFLEAFRSLSRFRGDSAFSTWLYRITINVAASFLRRRGRRAGEEDEALEVVPTLDDSPATLAETRELAERAARQLARLKPKHRVAFVLRHVEGLSIEEIARLVGAKGPAVAQRIRKAERVLADGVARERRREEERA
jgi:RNA polymerase sigma-70 factor (ECF subfamily)